MLTYDNIVILFFIYSFIGYICEVLYCSLGQRKLVNRGYLYGPYLPIYGSGALVVILLLNPLKEYWPLVFIGGVLFTSTIEYFSSWLLEKLFLIKLWDYSSYPLNIKGRVCALNSTLFGIMSLFTIYIAHPHVLNFINRIPLQYNRYITEVILVAMSVDTALSTLKYINFRQALVKAMDKSRQMEEKIVLMIRNVARFESIEELKVRLSEERLEFLNELSTRYKAIFKNNPSLTSKKQDIQLQLLNLKLFLEEKKSKLKDRINEL